MTSSVAGHTIRTAFEQRMPSVQQLRERGTVKWNTYPEDVLPLWVAEMDLPTAPPILDALEAAIRRENFGYPLADHPRLQAATAEWHRRRYGAAINPDFVHDVPGVLTGLRIAIDSFTEAGTAVILPIPSYPPFLDVIRQSGREVIEIPMLNPTSSPAYDFDAIERAFASGAGSIILCNPHNPLGRAFTLPELTRLSQIVAQYGGRVLSDEIHAPLVYGSAHVPYATISDEAATHTVTITAASKAWNIAGLKCAQVILSSSADQDVWAGIHHLIPQGATTLGMEATIAAYSEGGPWLDETLNYLRGNRDRVVAWANDVVPEARMVAPEATYLGWIDFAEADLPGDPYDFFLGEAKVALNPGRHFGSASAASTRINFGTTAPVLERALEAMTGAIQRNARG
ncbi:MalY/PatB family protein [Lysinibacter cavernae]|uniref:cysteine-S-conjugate beta-lyase n=1 Tax=Lysinibacter cavernae TaxID=1640652 RepID=A0A7X5R4K8_9MICO|nr:aminotransferase class I/II-fold pyridoxal phosphate-dependent enzyme [Lysinibacter cavernae]NIH54060.1 cystathionine beta-lyase [Lysinibacter cavernae]NIH55262.1 cystathionine beta-lyase [Lysinibacter cavernae]